MSENNASVFASRQLQTTDNDAITVTITIGAPYSADGRWRCPLTIVGLEKEISINAPGIDGMQALFNALTAARHNLIKSGRSFEYAGGVPGHGFPRILHDIFGDGFIERMEAMVDAEEQRHGAELKELVKRKLIAEGKPIPKVMLDGSGEQ